MAERDDSRVVSGALEALLQVEDAAARRLVEARRASEDAVRRAREAAERSKAERSRALDDATRELNQRLDNEHQRALASIETKAREQAQRFETIGEAELSAHAEVLLGELLDFVVGRERGP